MRLSISALIAAAVQSCAPGGCDPPAPPTPPPVTLASPFTGDERLFAHPNSDYFVQAATWQSTRPADANVMRRVGANATALWVDHQGDPGAPVRDWMEMAAAQGSLPIIVLYDIPQRDCKSGFSAGGAPDAASYHAFLDQVAAQITGPAIVIVEPDALPEVYEPCVWSDQRIALLQAAIDRMQATEAHVFIDVGNPLMHEPQNAVSLLNLVSRMDGFTTNLSFYLENDRVIPWAEHVAVGSGLPYIVDTSRNGVPAVDDQFCNPPNRALGQPPTLNPGPPHAAGYLWIKPPGTSDGDCNRGEPSAGAWWPERLLELARNAGY
jgi:endoglucanase